MDRIHDVVEERTRTLYVRMPFTIKDPKVVEEFFQGNGRVKLPRQSSRACHVIFANVEDKAKALKLVKNKKINKKRVVVRDPRPKPLDKRISKKKVKIPKPEPPLRITQTLFVSNIKDGTQDKELMKAFPGAIYVKILPHLYEGTKEAFVKMESFNVAGQYLRKEKPWPQVQGQQLQICPEKEKKKTNSSEASMMLYNEDGEISDSTFENLAPKRPRMKKVEVTKP